MPYPLMLIVNILKKLCHQLGESGTNFSGNRCIYFFSISVLTLKAPRKNAMKMPSADVVCCKKLPNITYELSKEANSVDPE